MIEHRRYRKSFRADLTRAHHEIAEIFTVQTQRKMKFERISAPAVEKVQKKSLMAKIVDAVRPKTAEPKPEEVKSKPTRHYVRKAKSTPIETSFADQTKTNFAARLNIAPPKIETTQA